MTSNGKSSPPHPPRLCRIVRDPNFNGYGFNLHTIKNKTGQFIGQVDEGSPAERALLKQGDRIIEVNKVNIASENHKQVVSRIKLVADETLLLVVDAEGDKWYKEHNVVITASLPEVVRGTSLPSSKGRHPSSSSSSSSAGPRKEGKGEEDRRSLASAASSAATSEASPRQDPSIVAPATIEKNEDSFNEASDDESEKAEKTVIGIIVTEQDAGPATSQNGGDKKDDESSDSDEDDVAAGKVISNGKHEEPIAEEVVEEVEASSAPVESSDSESDDEATARENLKNVEVAASPVKEIIQESDAASKRDADQDSVSNKSGSSGSHRSHSVSSASSRESAGHSQGTDPVVDKSPVSTSPSPPSSVGAPSPTPASKTAYKSNGLNMNMTAAEMRAQIASKKKKDIRHTEIDLRKKYEIIQKL